MGNFLEGKIGVMDKGYFWRKIGLMDKGYFLAKNRVNGEGVFFSYQFNQGYDLIFFLCLQTIQCFDKCKAIIGDVLRDS